MDNLRLCNWYHASTKRRAMVRSAYHFLLDFISDVDGGPLVEFSVLAPIFFLIMFGIIEWGNIFYVENNMLIAAREAARSWAVGTITSPTTAINNACASPFLNGANYTYKFTFSYHTGCTGASSPANTYGLVTLNVTTPAVPVSIFNYLGGVTGLNLSASATFQEEFVCPAAAGTAGPTTQSC
jgi:Flp pilus assembly protein TadG